VVNSGYQSEMKLGDIAVWGVTTGPSHVTVNGMSAVFQYVADTKVSIGCANVGIICPMIL